jgi:hypothetical protein
MYTAQRSKVHVKPSQAQIKHQRHDLQSAGMTCCQQLRNHMFSASKGVSSVKTQTAPQCLATENNQTIIEPSELQHEMFGRSSCKHEHEVHSYAPTHSATSFIGYEVRLLSSANFRQLVMMQFESQLPYYDIHTPS